MANFTVFRCAKVKANEVSYVHNHNQRTYENQLAENVDFQRTHLNKVLLGSQNTHQELKSKLDNLDSKKAIRKDANVMLEMIFSASPEFFYKNLDREKFDKLTMKNNKSELADLFNKNLDKEKLEQFTKTVVDFCNEKFKDNIVNLTLHLDEKTPHFHLTLTPIIEGKLSAKRFWTPQTTQAWQNDFAKACEPLGLVKGMDDSQAVHQTCKDYKSSVSIEIPEPPSKGFSKVPSENEIFKKTFFGSEKQIIDTRDILKAQQKRENDIHREFDFYRTFYNENKETLKKTQQAIFENKQLQKENLEMKKTLNKISQERQNELKRISLIAVLQHLGYEPKKESDSFYRVKTQDKNIVINVDRNTFSENKTSTNGYGAISMLMDVFDYDFRDAIDTLSTKFSPEQIASVASCDKGLSKSIAKYGIEKSLSVIPEKKDKNTEKVVDYLTKKRHIDKDIVDSLVNIGMLYADSKNNCVFTSEDKKFAFIRGTQEDKRFVANRGQMDFIRYGKGNQSNNIYLFESVIDCLSYMTLNKNAEGMFVSINGSAMINRVHELGLDNYKNVVCCFDNDEQGKKFDEKIKEQTISNVVVDKPKYKDFNDDLAEINTKAGKLSASIDNEKTKPKTKQKELERTPSFGFGRR